jgi:hypothetical protein
MKKAVLALSSLSLVLCSGLAVAGDDSHCTSATVWDDFQNGFTLGAPGSSSKWFYQQVGALVYNDGTPDTDRHGVHINPLGKNPHTGQPAYTFTAGQEDDPTQNPYGLPGDIDHPKFLAYANHIASTGVPGFDLIPGQEMACEVEMWGENYGVDKDPYHRKDPNADPRLSSYALTAVDFETFIVADFFVTNEEIYVLYERLPFARGTLGNYASFTHTIPVGRTAPNEHHKFAIAWDKSRGTIRWLVDRREVFQVDHEGDYLDRKLVTIDRGGDQTIVSPRQIDCGIGTFTLLDGYRPGDIGLARLASTPGYYVNPDTHTGDATFIDNLSKPEDRLWGQGATLNVKSIVFSYRRSDDRNRDDLSGY